MLRLQHEADCLSSHRTERSLRPHPISRPRSGATLPRERFSPTTPSGLWDLSIAAAQNRNSGHCTLSHPGTNDCGRSTSIHPAKPRLYRGTARSVCGCRHNTALQIASYKLTRRKKRPTPHRRAGRLNNASIKGQVLCSRLMRCLFALSASSAAFAAVTSCVLRKRSISPRGDPEPTPHSSRALINALTCGNVKDS